MGDQRSRSARLIAKRTPKSKTPTSPTQSDAADPPQLLEVDSDDGGPFVPDESDLDVTAKPKGKCVRKDSVDTAGSGTDEETAKTKKKPVKKKAKKVTVEDLDPDRKLVLMIPQAASTGLQRERLTHSTSFDDALALIYETIGCADVPKKPLLSFKLSNAPGKAPAITLASEKDWKGCLDDVTDVEVKKKIQVLVTIIVTDQYMASLRAKLGRTDTGGPAKGKGKKMTILDLEHAGSGDDDFDDGLGIMEKEAKCLEQLQNHHCRCQLCGPTKWCKIDRASNHHHLTNNQLRGWACSLAAGTHEVTLKRPPRDEMFGMFHKNFVTEPPVPPAAAATPFAGMPSFMGMPPYGFMPWNMPGGSAFGQSNMPFPGAPDTPTPLPRPSHTPHASTSSRAPTMPSSDPPDMGAANPYTEIEDFIKQLHEYNPKRRLLDYVDRFTDLDYYHIDEVAKLGTPENLADQLKMTSGNASFLLTKIKDEMKRIDRASK